MQIHEITHKQKLDEGVGDVLGYMGGKTVSGVKNFGSAIASPFKDIAQGYKTARMDQQTSALADKMYRAWQQYSVQWAKSQGGTYTQPGKGGATTQSASTATDAATTAKTKSTAKRAQDLFATVQSLDNKKLNAVATILSQRVGPQATMNALKQPEQPSQVTEVDWRGLGSSIKQGASALGQQIKQGAQLAPQFAKQVGQGYKKAAQAGIRAVKAAPGAVSSAVGGTAGAIAGMPAATSTAYRSAKQRVAGPQMTMPELQTALVGLSKTEAQKLLNYVQQIQQMRKAGIREGVTPDTLIPSYEQALKAFVQKNMLAGMQYSRLQNVQQIDDLIKKIVDPANDTAAAQKDLWNKLTLAAGVAQHTAAQAGGAKPAAGGEETGAVAGAGGTENADQIKDALIADPKFKDKIQSLQTVGGSVRAGFTNNAADVKSTGVPAVDAMLMIMGFKPA